MFRGALSVRLGGRLESLSRSSSTSLLSVISVGRVNDETDDCGTNCWLRNVQMADKSSDSSFPTHHPKDLVAAIPQKSEVYNRLTSQQFRLLTI